MTIDPVFLCDLADGRLDRDGYAYHGKSRAHIVAWEAVHGPRPLGSDGAVLELDHACRRRHCRAVHHIEPVTARENLLRRSWPYRARMTICQFGHSLDGALVTPEMGRLCRCCDSIARHGKCGCTRCRGTK